MDIVNVRDDGGCQHLERRHANGPKNAARQQRLVAVRMVRPHARDEQEQISTDNHRASAKFDTQPVRDEARDAYGEDRPPEPAIQVIVCHVELDRHFGEARCDHGTPCADDRSVDADDSKEELFLPLGPIEWVTGRFRRLGDENDVFVASGGMLQP